jgi:hypothetical protein
LLAVEGDAAAGDEAMDMGVMGQRLSLVHRFLEFEHMGGIPGERGRPHILFGGVSEQSGLDHGGSPADGRVGDFE